MFKCVNCGFKIDGKFNYCPNCGSNLNSEITNQNKPEQEEQLNTKVITCDICGEISDSGKGYCENCGAKLTGNELAAHPVKKTIIEKAANQQPLKNKVQEKRKVHSEVRKNKEHIKNNLLNDNKKKTITNVQLGLLLSLVIVIVPVILWTAGVFNSNKSDTAPVAQENIKPEKIDLSRIQEINDLEKIVRDDTTNISNVLELAHKLNDSGFFERAIEYYNMYLRNNPGNVDVQIDLGVCYFELKMYDKAKSEMKKGLKINPTHQIGLFNLGIVNFSQGNLDSAKYWWKKSIEIDANTDIAKKAKQLLESN